MGVETQINRRRDKFEVELLHAGIGGLVDVRVTILSLKMTEVEALRAWLSERFEFDACDEPWVED